MRLTKILTAAAALIVASAMVTPAAAHAFTGPVPAVGALTISAVQQTQEPPKIDVTVQTDETRTVWYTDPVWIAVGAIALLVVILLAVMAARSGDRGGTTVVR